MSPLMKSAGPEMGTGGRGQEVMNMRKSAFSALVVALLVPAIGFGQVVLPPGQMPATGYGSYPTNTYPSGNYPGGTVVNGVQYPGTIPAGTLPGSVGSVPGYNTPIGGANQTGLYNPYDDPRYSRQYGNRYYDNTYLNRGMSPAIVPALMGAVVGAVLGAHFGFKGILLGGIAGFLVGNAVWQHFTGQSVFDFLFYGPFYNPYAYGQYGSPYGGYGYGQYQGGSPYGGGYGYGGVGYGGVGGYPGYGYGGVGSYPGYGYGGYMPAATRLTVNGGLMKDGPGAPGTDLESLRKGYFEQVAAYQNALKAGGDATASRNAMETSRAAYQKALEAAAGTSK